jgi:hypothetical protein
MKPKLLSIMPTSHSSRQLRHIGSSRIDKVAFWFFAVGYLLFSHGCHPHDLDEEVMERFRQSVQSSLGEPAGGTEPAVMEYPNR